MCMKYIFLILISNISLCTVDHARVERETVAGSPVRKLWPETTRKKRVAGTGRKRVG